MDRKPDALGDTVSDTSFTEPDAEPSTAPTLIAGGAEQPPPGSAGAPSLRYRLGELLGSGGMGEVMSARDQQIGRSVAIKRLRGSTSEHAVARFLREAKIQGRLDHPAIVPVHELCRDSDDRPYFVMKQLAGITLADVLAKGAAEMARTFTRQGLLRAFVDVCLAVEFAHTRQIIHRDLKPANIMLGDFGEVYVLDWGIARTIGDVDRPSLAELDAPEAQTAAGTVLGTPGYMSPEQIRGEPDLDGRVDVFALGCILYELLAGSPLYPRGTAGVAQALSGGVDARPSARAADVPPELDAACVAATATEREDRIATARELADIVERYLDGDRDHALRRNLAKDELAQAKAALDRGNAPADQREAMRAAARALALDPHAKEPAQLVGRLMIEPPTEIPDEVTRETRDTERQLFTGIVKTSLISLLAYYVFFPFAYLAGIDELWFLIGGPVLLTVIIVLTRLAAGRTDFQRFFRINFVFNCALIAMLSHAFTPFMIAPPLVTTLVMVYSLQPRAISAWVTIAGGLSAVLGPFVLELAGVLRNTVSFTDTAMQLDPVGDHVDGTISIVGLVVFAVGIIAAATLISRHQANNRDALQRTLQLQAWRLKQLVPQDLGSVDSRSP